MGCTVRFVAFTTSPDPGSLRALNWLTAFRLHKERDRAAWFLEGPSPDSEGVTFFEPLGVDRREAGKLGAAAETEAARLEAAIKGLGGDPGGLDDDLVHALMLSAALRTSSLFVYGDDEGHDGAFVCSDGRLAGGRVQIDWNKALAIGADGSFTLESLHPRGADPNDASLGRPLYMIASAVAADYFGSSAPRPITSDPTELDPFAYSLVASKGAAEAVLEHEAKRRLSAIWSSQLSPAVKLRRYVALIDRYVSEALGADMIAAERRVRELEGGGLLQCSLHVGFLVDVERRRGPYEALRSYLHDLGAYMRELRPKPAFRRRKDFHAIRRRLTWRWRILRARLAIASRLVF